MQAEGSWSGWLLSAAYAGGTICAGALLLLYAFQDKLLYFPTVPGASKLTRDNPAGEWGALGRLVLTMRMKRLTSCCHVGYRNPGEFGIDFEDLMIPAADGVRVHAWLMKQPDHSTRPTIIFFHGNAGSACDSFGGRRQCLVVLIRSHC